MKSFEKCTPATQFRRLRILAVAALEHYALHDWTLRPLVHQENTSFRVDAKEGRFTLRIHRPGYHSDPTIGSELAWLVALNRDTELKIPSPLPASNKALLVHATAPGVPETRTVSVMHWVEGRIIGSPAGIKTWRAIGAFIARLHDHAETLNLASFERPQWSSKTLCSGSVMGSSTDFPDGVLEIFHEVQQRAEDRFPTHLIHADLHCENLLRKNGEIRAIDFDDCGIGSFVYDLAVALYYNVGRAGCDRARKELLAGYRERRAFSVEEENALDAWIAVRAVTLIQWVASRTDNPDFAIRKEKMLARDIPRLGRFLETGRYG